MKLYVTRHGQTDYNKDEIILGVTDLPLNETGLAQAAELAENAEKLGDIDIIISSPMKRAFTTAKAVADRCGLEIITEERLREWDYGEYEGKSRFMGRSGESLLQLSHRVYSVLDEIKAKYRDKNVLVVCHGGICRVIETYFNDLTNEEYSNWFMGNCQVIEYSL